MLVHHFAHHELGNVAVGAGRMLQNWNIDIDGGGGWRPPANREETVKELVVFIALPGIDKKDISIDVKDGVLRIGGEDAGSEGGTFVRRELAYGRFVRSFTLPTGIGADDLRASCKDGLLKVRVARPKEPQSTSIKIDGK